MAVTSLQITYVEIREHLAQYLSVNRDPAQWGGETGTIATDVARAIRSGLRKAYYPPPLRAGEPPHQWSFLRPWKTLTTNLPYETGTITVVNGVVTLAGGTWPTWANGGFLSYGGKHYEVSTRDSGTQLTLIDDSEANDAVAGTTFALYQYRFTLPSDFESIMGPLFYSPDQSLENIPIERRSDDYLRMLYQDSDLERLADEPRYFAIYPASSVTTSAQDWYLIIWPFARSIFHLKYRYQLQMDDLDGTNDTPPGGTQHSEMILEACLSEAELKLNDGVGGEHTAKWKELLAAAIDRDLMDSTADTLGPVPIKSPDYARRTLAVTSNDYAILEGYQLSDFET